MSISINHCKESDLPRTFEIISQAFRHDKPFIDIYFPNHCKPAGRAQGTERLIELKRTDPTARLLKATDDTTGKIIGMCIWSVLTEPPSSTLEGDYCWDNDFDKEYAKCIWAEYVKPRSQVIRAAKGPVYVMEMLAVDPAHRRRGAGSILTKWGVDEADKIGAEALVEATDPALRTYERNGFRTTIKEMQFKVPEKFAGERKPILKFMRRPSKHVA